MKLPPERERVVVILNPFAIQDKFTIFGERFERLKNFRKILSLVALTHSGYLVNYFHSPIELRLFGEVPFSNINSKNDEI